jgi:uncharacterized membrane protein
MPLLMLIYIATSALIIVLSVPMMQRKVKPNRWYGFRVPKTLNNPDIWYDANAYCGRWLVIAGAATIIASLVFGVIPDISLDLYVMLVTVVMIVSMFIGLGMSFKYLGTL